MGELNVLFVHFNVISFFGPSIHVESYGIQAQWLNVEEENQT